MPDSRVRNSVQNAKIYMLFYFASLFLSFFSRKIFLDCLGSDFVGLTGTMGNLLEFLNLAELGIGSAIGTVLYKPLFEKDKGKINEIISVFGYFYRKIGFVILGMGIVLSLFLPLIFSKTMFAVFLVFAVFYSFLISSLIGYFANYKQTLLAADQRNYIIVSYFQTSNIIKTLIQMSFAYYMRSWYCWVFIEFCFGVLYSIALNKKINQVYPWLKSSIKNGEKLRSQYPLIMVYAKQLFVHKIGGLAQFQIKPLLIYGFVSLQVVAFYGNYALIIDKVILLLRNLLGSASASVGSLVAEGDKIQIKKIYWELTALNYFISGILVFSIYNIIEPFIFLWIGREYILSREVLGLILCNMFIMQTRATNDQFLFAYGLFHDIWAPLVEAGLSIVISLIGGIYWGLEGILLGSVISMLLIVVLWKPYFLYRYGFKEEMREYWSGVFKYSILIAISSIVSCFLLKKIPVDPYSSYVNWIIYSAIVGVIFSSIMMFLFYWFAPGFYLSIKRVMDKYKRV